MDNLVFESEEFFEKHYLFYLPAILKMPKADMIPVNLDCPSVYRVSIAALKNVEPYMPFVEKLPYLDLPAVHDLKGLACGLSHAHSLYQAVKVSPNELIEQVQKAESLSETFQVDIEALVRHGVIEPVTFPNPPVSAGYKIVAEGLQSRANYLKGNWSKIVGKCSVLPEQINEAIASSALIQNTVALRESGHDPESEVTHIRQGLFTRVVYSYCELRRGVLYYRDHEHDADILVPSLYSVCRSSHRSSSESTASDNAKDKETDTDKLDDQDDTLITKNVPGGPGGNPFTD